MCGKTIFGLAREITLKQMSKNWQRWIFDKTRHNKSSITDFECKKRVGIKIYGKLKCCVSNNITDYSAKSSGKLLIPMLRLSLDFSFLRNLFS